MKCELSIGLTCRFVLICKVKICKILTNDKLSSLTKNQVVFYKKSKTTLSTPKKPPNRASSESKIYSPYPPLKS